MDDLTEIKTGYDARESRDLRAEAEHCIIKKYRRELWSRFTEAINTYRLISDGDRIAVCISGGKDSFLMAKLFQELHAHGRQNFSVEFISMDPGYSRENRESIEYNAGLLGIPVKIFEADIFDEIKDISGTPCYMCARKRRGALYAQARSLNCNKIALGHHYDDVIETTLMGLLYSGQFQTMMPKLHSTNFEGMELIRPLCLIREEDIKRWRDHLGLNFLRCACRVTAMRGITGKEGYDSKRSEIKELIRKLKEDNPFVEANIYRSAENVSLNTVVCYKDKNGIRHRFLDD